ncbi:MAG: TIGR04255 family protein [Acidobacteriota bacterium]
MKNKNSLGALVRREYEEPSVIEALIEVYFSQTMNDFSVWSDFNNRIKKKYPTVEESIIPKAEIQVNQSGESHQRISPEKLYRFYQKDKSKLVQANKDFISVHQLKPYSGYENFRAEAEKIINDYVSVTEPKMVNRIGMRYINQVMIPETNVELSRYFKFMPQIPEEVTDGINDVLLQIQFVPRNSNHQIMTSLRSGNSSLENQVVFFLDIYDIIQLNNEIEIADILKSLDEAHNNIERVFEGFITDEARKLFGVVKKNGRKRKL